MLWRLQKRLSQESLQFWTYFCRRNLLPRLSILGWMCAVTHSITIPASQVFHSQSVWKCLKHQLPSTRTDVQLQPIESYRLKLRCKYKLWTWNKNRETRMILLGWKNPWDGMKSMWIEMNKIMTRRKKYEEGGEEVWGKTDEMKHYLEKSTETPSGQKTVKGRMKDWGGNRNEKGQNTTLHPPLLSYYYLFPRSHERQQCCISYF